MVESTLVECPNCREDLELDGLSTGYWVSKVDLDEVMDAVSDGEDSETILDLVTEGVGVFGYRCEECGYIFGNGEE